VLGGSHLIRHYARILLAEVPLYEPIDTRHHQAAVDPAQKVVGHEEKSHLIGWWLWGRGGSSKHRDNAIQIHAINTTIVRGLLQAWTMEASHQPAPRGGATLA